MSFFRTFIILSTVALGFILMPQVFADLLPPDQFEEWYYPKLDRVHQENLPPTKQIEIGIFDVDIVCHENKVRVLKISAEKYIACVFPETTISLVQRGWGLANTDNEPYANYGSNDCASWWEIHHDDKNVPSMSKIIKTFRQTIDEFSVTSVVWASVSLIDHKDNVFRFLSDNSFDDQHRNLILDNFSTVEHVKNVEFYSGGCH